MRREQLVGRKWARRERGASEANLLSNGLAWWAGVVGWRGVLAWWAGVVDWVCGMVWFGVWVVRYSHGFV